MISSGLPFRILITKGVGVPTPRTSAVGGLQIDQWQNLCPNYHGAQLPPAGPKITPLRPTHLKALGSYSHVSRIFASNSYMKVLLCSRGDS